MIKAHKIFQALRESKGITVEEIAKILNIPIENVKFIESGRMAPLPETFIGYANALGITVEEMMLMHINDYVNSFAAKAGITKRFQVSVVGEECGTSYEAVRGSNFKQLRGSVLPPSERRMIID